MTHVVIIEDERLSAERLRSLVEEPAGYVVSAVLDSVEAARQWLKDNSPPDLVLLDIQLNDGLGFDLLTTGEIKCPVIFTTAYHEYAVKAFKFDGIDYLLKPIDREELGHALLKFQRHAAHRDFEVDPRPLQNLTRLIAGDFKKRFLVKLGDRFQSVAVPDIAYFVSQDELTYLVGHHAGRWPIDSSLDQLEGLISPLDFFRINRKLIVSLSAIKEIHSYFNSRLLLTLYPPMAEEVIVSRDRVANFKRWMDL